MFTLHGAKCSLRKISSVTYFSVLHTSLRLATKILVDFPFQPIGLTDKTNPLHSSALVVPVHLNSWCLILTLCVSPFSNIVMKYLRQLTPTERKEGIGFQTKNKCIQMAPSGPVVNVIYHVKSPWKSSTANHPDPNKKSKQKERKQKEEDNKDEIPNILSQGHVLQRLPTMPFFLIVTPADQVSTTCTLRDSHANHGSLCQDEHECHSLGHCKISKHSANSPALTGILLSSLQAFSYFFFTPYVLVHSFTSYILLNLRVFNHLISSILASTHTSFFLFPFLFCSTYR